MSTLHMAVVKEEGADRSLRKVQTLLWLFQKALYFVKIPSMYIITVQMSYPPLSYCSVSLDWMRLQLNHVAEEPWQFDAAVCSPAGPAPGPLLCYSLLSRAALLPTLNWFCCLDTSQSQYSLLTWEIFTLVLRRFLLILRLAATTKEKDVNKCRKDVWVVCLFVCFPLSFSSALVLEPSDWHKLSEGSQEMSLMLFCMQPLLCAMLAACEFMQLRRALCWKSPGWVRPLFMEWCSCARKWWILLIQALFSIFPKGANSAH